MKRILIVNNNMYIGGVQKALVNLLNEIHAEYKVTLLLFYAGGALIKDIPDDVEVISAAAPFRYWGIAKHDVNRCRDRIFRAFWAGLTRVVGRPFSIRIANLFQERIREYDVAISFLHSGACHVFYGGCNEFVLNRVNSKKKITFLHCDYGAIKANSKYNKQVYEQFDIIAACSGGCKNAFLKELPWLRNKMQVVPNFQNYALISELARKQPVKLTERKLNIITVARFGKEKGIVRAIYAIAALDNYLNRIAYYIIGSGAEYSEVKRLISKFQLDDIVFLPGEMENPYGYMKAADVLLIPSISEAAPMVINEAASLGTPVLTTDTSSAMEMVADTGIGWVCPNTREGITQGIRMLIEKPEEIRNKKDRISSLDFNNIEAKRKFIEMV